MALERHELDLATKQGGVLTRAQLLQSGRSRRWLEREVSAGRLIRIKYGVYRAIHLDGHENLLRAAVATLPRATVSHESAAHLQRFPVLPPLRPTVTVHSSTTHVFPGVTVRRNTDLQPDQIIRVSGLDATNMLRTLFDLAGVLDEKLLDQIVEALCISSRLQIPQLEMFVEKLRRRGKPGSTAMTSVIERRSGVDASELERLGLAVLRQRNVPDPVLQYPAPWDDRQRIDAAWPPCLVGVEWDSQAWHSAMERMRSDRQRDRSASLAGWVVLRYTWFDLTEEPQSVADEILRLLSARAPRSAM